MQMALCRGSRVRVKPVQRGQGAGGSSFTTQCREPDEVSCAATVSSYKV